MSDILTAERLREVLSYDPETGVFVWKANSRSTRAGEIAGSDHNMGYRRISVFNKRYLAHRLAWLFITGTWPSQNIDHIDGDRKNNRFSNLRDVSQLTNVQNRRESRKPGKLLGVFKTRNRWEASVTVSGKTIRVGTFDTPERAHEAYLEAKRKLHNGCTI